MPLLTCDPHDSGEIPRIDLPRHAAPDETAQLTLLALLAGDDDRPSLWRRLTYRGEHRRADR